LARPAVIKVFQNWSSAALTYGSKKWEWRLGIGRGRQPAFFRARWRRQHQLLRHRGHSTPMPLARDNRTRTERLRQRVLLYYSVVVIATQSLQTRGRDTKQRGLLAQKTSNHAMRRTGHAEGLAGLRRSLPEPPVRYHTPIEEEEENDDARGKKIVRDRARRSILALPEVPRIQSPKCGPPAGDQHGRGASSPCKITTTGGIGKTTRESCSCCREEGSIGVIPWSPLARGFIARPIATTQDFGGNHARQTNGICPESLTIVSPWLDRVTTIARQRGNS